MDLVVGKVVGQKGGNDLVEGIIQAFPLNCDVRTFSLGWILVVLSKESKTNLEETGFWVVTSMSPSFCCCFKETLLVGGVGDRSSIWPIERGERGYSSTSVSCTLRLRWQDSPGRGRCSGETLALSQEGLLFSRGFFICQRTWQGSMGWMKHINIVSVKSGGNRFYETFLLY